jgi:hypothetical protein
MKITISMQEAKEILVAKYASILGCSKEELKVEIQNTEGETAVNVESAVNTESDSEGWIENDIDSWCCPDYLKGKMIEVVYEDIASPTEILKAEYFDFRLGYDWSIVKYRIVK